jgi:hypothetical protein
MLERTNPTTAAPQISAQQPSRWVRGRRNTFVGLVLQSSLKNRKANVVLALSEIPGFQLCRPARDRKRSSSPSQFLSPSLRLRSLERFVRQSRKHIRILGHPQHDIGIETAQPQAPRAPRLQETGGWLELISHGRTLCSKVRFSRTRSHMSRGILLIGCTGKPTKR